MSPGPYSVKIYSKSELAGHHLKGRFLEVSADQFVFGRKRKKSEKKYVAIKKSDLGEFQNSSSGNDVSTSSAQVSGQASCLDKDVDPDTAAIQVVNRSDENFGWKEMLEEIPQEEHTSPPCPLISRSGKE